MSVNVKSSGWWLPYLVMEFEVNQVLISPLGGTLAKPVYMYPAHL
jgi:serum/glucocorticoid-regulated kinase 2